MNGMQMRFAAAVGALALACATWAATGVEDFEISRSTIDGGGIMFSTGGDFELSGTIGQPDAGSMIGGDFELTGGFWFATPLGDCDQTGCVDLFDYSLFEPCLTGPEGGILPGCGCFDVDGSGAVDLLDYGVIQTGFTG